MPSFKHHEHLGCSMKLLHPFFRMRLTALSCFDVCHRHLPLEYILEKRKERWTPPKKAQSAPSLLPEPTPRSPHAEGPTPTIPLDAPESKRHFHRIGVPPLPRLPVPSLRALWARGPHFPNISHIWHRHRRRRQEPTIPEQVIPSEVMVCNISSNQGFPTGLAGLLIHSAFPVVPAIFTQATFVFADLVMFIDQ